MKRLVIVVVLLAGSLVCGCCNTGSPGCGGCGAATLTETAPERSRRIALQYNLQMKMLVEDWDYFWLSEKNSSLTQWHPYVGY